MHSHRLLFAKEGPARYISHLDLMRTFPRAFLRAGIPLKHTEGFHPHAAISIALPLPIGCESVCELLDFTPDGELNLQTLPECLNRALPEGIRALSCLPFAAPLKTLQSVRYELRLRYDSGVPEGAAQQLRELFAQESLPVPKKIKPSKGNPQKPEETDIRPMLRALTVRNAEERLLMLDTVVAARDPGLNPTLITAAIHKFCPEAAPDFVSYRRTALLDGEMRPFF